MDARLADLTRSIGRELRLAAAGMTQREIARRSQLSQSMVSRTLSGEVSPRLPVLLALADAVGHKVSLKFYPEAGVGLRDSGQLGLAEVIRANCHHSWRVALEVPVGQLPDRRAADMVLSAVYEINMVEIERGLFDFQAQLRAAVLKREAMVVRVGRPVNLILAVPDTPLMRKRLAAHASIIKVSLPIPSAKAWASIRAGTAIGGDGLLWVRASRLRGTQG
jgi:transcriptional regulator with XRE-family HTH domain